MRGSGGEACWGAPPWTHLSWQHGHQGHRASASPARPLSTDSSEGSAGPCTTSSRQVQGSRTVSTRTCVTAGDGDTQTADGIGDTQGADGARGRHPAPQALGRRPRDAPGAGRGGAGGEAGLGSSRTPAPGSCTRRLTPTRCPTPDTRAFTVTVTPLLSSSRQQHRKRMGTTTRAKSPSHDK